MLRKQEGASLGRSEKKFFSVILLLVGLAFGAVVVFSVFGIFTELRGWVDGRSWQPAMAEIVDSGVRQTGTRQSGFRYITVTYRYSVGGANFDGNRVGWSDSTWTPFSDWHYLHDEALRDAQNAKTGVVVWYDPASPDMAVVDRDLRWSLLFFLAPLGFVFSLLSFAMLWLLRQFWTPDVPPRH